MRTRSRNLATLALGQPPLIQLIRVRSVNTPSYVRSNNNRWGLINHSSGLSSELNSSGPISTVTWQQQFLYKKQEKKRKEKDNINQRAKPIYPINGTVPKVYSTVRRVEMATCLWWLLLLLSLSLGKLNLPDFPS